MIGDKEKSKPTHTPMLSSASSASITAATLREPTDTAADVIAEDTFVSRIGHGCVFTL